MLESAVQLSAGHHGTGTDPLAPFLAIAVTAAAGALAIAAGGQVVARLRGAVLRRRAPERPVRATVTAETRARVMMDELCPDGWQAQIVLFSSAEELPTDAPDPVVARVALDWAELGEPMVIRRVWARTVEEALEAMVAERITDETLLQIEERAIEDGVSWPDS